MEIKEFYQIIKRKMAQKIKKRNVFRDGTQERIEHQGFINGLDWTLGKLEQYFKSSSLDGGETLFELLTDDDKMIKEN